MKYDQIKTANDLITKLKLMSHDISQYASIKLKESGFPEDDIHFLHEFILQKAASAEFRLHALFNNEVKQ